MPEAAGAYGGRIWNIISFIKGKAQGLFPRNEGLAGTGKETEGQERNRGTGKETEGRERNSGTGKENGSGKKKKLDRKGDW